jgi:hypothetical protein
MVFHVTARHNVNDCAMYDENVRQALQEFVPSIPGRCKEMGVKLHFVVNAEPSHAFYLLIEADDYMAVCALLSAVPIKQEFDIKPVRVMEFEQS